MEKKFVVETDHGDQPDISKNEPKWLREGKNFMEKNGCTVFICSCLSKNTCFIFLSIYIPK